MLTAAPARARAKAVARAAPPAPGLRRGSWARKLFLERTQDAEVVGIASIERAVAAHHYGVYRADFRSQGITVL